MRGALLGAHDVLRAESAGCAAQSGGRKVRPRCVGMVLPS